ncbi:hypothetical protein BASA81_011982 [Batrachochytrium salamandrivorans]|nr:hypothetical protein BASA81_011982 [Batrachochytrium salamandrivorans]
MQGARIRKRLDATIVKSFKAWVPRSEAADKDKLAAISSFAVKTSRPSNAVPTPQGVSPIKTATEKEPAAPAADPPSDTAAEITPATQDDGATLQSPLSLTLKCRLERQSKQTHWRIRQNYRHRRPDQPRPTAPPPPLSRQILAVNVANISNKRPAIRHIVRNTRLWAISETCITSSKFRFTVPGFDVIQHPATGPGRRGIALGIPSCFDGHEHGSAIGTMILVKVPNFTPECLWIVGSVYVGHSEGHTNYSRREAFASIRQSLDRVVPFDNNHPVLIFGDWNTDPQRLQRIVHSWGHGLTVIQFLDHRSPDSAQSMVDVIRQLTTLCVMHQPAHSLPRHVWTDRQQWPTTLSFAHPFEQRLKDNPLSLVLQQYPAITVSKPLIGLLHPIMGCASRRCNRRHTPTQTSTN